MVQVLFLFFSCADLPSFWKVPYVQKTSCTDKKFLARFDSYTERKSASKYNDYLEDLLVALKPDSGSLIKTK